MNAAQIHLDTQGLAYHLRIVCVSEQIEKTGVIIEKAAEKRKKHHDFLLS